MSDTVATLPPPPARRLDSVTPTGVALVVLWGFVAVVVVYGLAHSVDAESVEKYGPRIFKGYLITLKLVGLSFAIGVILSIPIAVGRLSHNRLAGGLAYAYSYFFRGTPLLAQIFLIYYGAGQFSSSLRAVGLWDFFKDSFTCALLAFSLNSAAYQAEILSGAIRSVPNGQREAAAALGLHAYVTMWRVVLPQALISALRPYANEIILLAKASAIASIVTVLDLMGQTRFVYSKTYDISFYIWAAVFYLVSVEVLSRVVNVIERILTRHLRHARVVR